MIGKLDQEKKSELVAYVLLILAMLIWGGTWPLGRWLVSEDVGGETIPPLMIVSIRYFIVIWLFFLILKWREGMLNSHFAREHWKGLVLIALTSVTLYQTGYMFGEYFTSASDASLIVATQPIWVMIVSGFALSESLGWKKALGAIIGFIGVILVVGFSPNVDVPNRLLGDMLILMAALANSVYAVISRHFINQSRKESSYQPTSLFIITWASFYGFLLTLPVSLLLSPEYLNPVLYFQVPERVWFGLAYLIILSTIGAYTMYMEGIKRLNASRAAVFINLVPIFGVTLSAVFLNEIIDPLIHLTALFLIIAGVTLVNKDQKND